MLLSNYSDSVKKAPNKTCKAKDYVSASLHKALYQMQPLTRPSKPILSAVTHCQLLHPQSKK